MSEVLSKANELKRRGYRIGEYTQKRDGYRYTLGQYSSVISIPIKAGKSLDSIVESVRSNLKALGYKMDKPVISGNEEHIKSNIWSRFEISHIGDVEISANEVSFSIGLGRLPKLAPYLDKLIEDNKSN